MITVRALKSQEQLDAIKAQVEPVILYFSTPQCGVCHAVLPKLVDALKDKPIEVIEIDALVHPEVAGQHHVFVAPTVLIYYEGREVLRESRFVDIRKITRLLDLIQAN
jgi:thiol-disulfide isomerase/thioredoxin